MTAVARIIPVHLKFEFDVKVEVPFVTNLDETVGSGARVQALADSIRDLIQAGVLDAIDTARGRLASGFKVEAMNAVRRHS